MAILPQNMPATASPDTPMSTVSVIVCSHLVERYQLLLAALSSLERQSLPADQIIVSIDGDAELLRLLQLRNGDELIVFSDKRVGLSAARNLGVAEATGEFIAFLDDDASAGPDWLRWLVAALKTDERVLGVGGRTLPEWQGSRPNWFPDELLWTVGCSHKGLPATRSRVRNVFGGCALFRSAIFRDIGGFDERLGRKAIGAAGCEETEFCIRAQATLPGHVFLYEPNAVIRHVVHSARQSPGYVLRRCSEEGRSKAIMKVILSSNLGSSSQVSPSGAYASNLGLLAPEQKYILCVLPRGIAASLWIAAKGGRYGLSRAALLIGSVIVAGLTFLMSYARLRILRFTQELVSRRIVMPARVNLHRRRQSDAFVQGGSKSEL
jgi:GT2 family glycosyltransferase